MFCMFKKHVIAYWQALKTDIANNLSQSENDYYYHETLQV
jgi:hypothetical protein